MNKVNENHFPVILQCFGKFPSDQKKVLQRWPQIKDDEAPGLPIIMPWLCKFSVSAVGGNIVCAEAGTQWDISCCSEPAGL